MRNKRLSEKIISLLITVVMICSLTLTLFPASVFADGDKCMAENITLTVNGADTFNVKAVNPYYVNNTYISLRDMAYALSGTEKNFDVTISDSEINIVTGTDYALPSSGNNPFSDAVTDEVYGLNYTLKLNGMKKDGNQVKYFTLIGLPDGVYDAFIATTDFALLFDIDIWFSNESLFVNTDDGFTIDINDLESRNYFSLVSGALVGDATTGEIYYEYEGDISVPVASTTKLMTYLVLMDAIARGNVSMEDEVIISENAHLLSLNSDSVMELTAGASVSLEDVVKGMLMASSNECALVIAEHVAGSEELFVDMMNTTADNLGLSDETVFYNCNGLPVYSDDIITAKLQNRMTPEDMFIICSHILNKYPQITDITSLKSASLPTLNVWVNNTNMLLYNMDSCVGLKTGTTNKAGACLVAAGIVYDGNTPHYIVAMEYGAENNFMRVTVAQVLLTYGMQEAEGEEVADHGPAAATETLVPDTAEGLCSLIVNAARANKPTEE